jgi:hypothetical protein
MQGPSKCRIFNDAGRVKSFFKFFLSPLTEFEHTSSSTHELRLFLSLRFIRVTLSLARPVYVHQLSVAHQTSLQS